MSIDRTIIDEFVERLLHRLEGDWLMIGGSVLLATRLARLAARISKSIKT